MGDGWGMGSVGEQVGVERRSRRGYNRFCLALLCELILRILVQLLMIQLGLYLTSTTIFQSSVQAFQPRHHLFGSRCIWRTSLHCRTGLVMVSRE